MSQSQSFGQPPGHPGAPRSSSDAPGVLAVAPSVAPSLGPSIKVALPLMLIVLAVCVVGWRSLVQAPATAGATGFTATAGMATLSDLLQEQAPHPVGSALHATVRDRILAVLRTAGYEPRVEPTLQCTARHGCGWVQNLIAVRRGSDSTRAVMISAHYDSVPAGPGAADDGAGTAILLELARELARRPQQRNDIIFLFSDGEEVGLLGAHAFLQRDAEMKRIPVLVNLEARGASGPSVMFETGDGNAELMKLYAKAVAHPVANSLAFEIYKRLPNGTDFTVYRNQGVIGFNLAFVGSASLYHTPLDNLSNLDRATMQHHGDNAFALTFALAAADLGAIHAPEDASYFDVFGRLLVQWPARWNLPAAGVALLMILLLMLLRRRQLGSNAGSIAWALFTIILPLALLGGLGYGLAYPLGLWPKALLLDHAMPWPGRAALLFAAVLVALLVAAPIGKKQAPLIATWAVWLLMSALSVFLSIAVPGAAYVLLLPSAGFAVTAFALLLTGVPGALFWASSIGFVLAAFFWTGTLMMFESALGFSQSMIKLLALAPLTWAAIPVAAGSFARPGARAALPILIAAAGMIAAAAAAALVPAVTPDTPRGIALVYHDDGTGSPRWFTHVTDDATPYLDAAGFDKEPVSVYFHGQEVALDRGKPATDQHLPPPTFARTGDTRNSAGQRVLTGTLRLPAESLAGGLTVGRDSGLLGLRVDGQQVWSETNLAGGVARTARFSGLSGRDLAIELTLAPGAKGPIVVYQRSMLAESAELRTLTTARPADATTFGFGDCAIISRRIPL
jgi:Peptidase family M28